MKILLVEDTELNIDLITRRLQKRKYETVVATDGQSGFNLAHSEKPDLILMDVGLPDMDGWEVTRRLKADPETAAIPIIILTASAMSEHRQKSIEAGCDDFEGKPIDFPALFSKIETLLQKRTG
ncbi:response regulator [Tuwongella immobilis]|uniref:Response regulatory domain-containing protein n=1 Tax=Tuwongella immobilis TaxID=692036 RepID=A0A6C2YRN6_9BACT|nr:response regulator [Tuwongella immobilis]VIP04320.1 chemotaxis protein : Response regulator receiver protein OS=Cyanothece sp. (strain PCC 7425 / ATCC 29141) GN=Cyan7425_0748 PE=4 SV=1: Response_reg [Tuwongella immobilis]VTS06002.1 chemotaxis protein : Response regulator receiver protein OS=Cyanothece sp. (strain PCC 7425 / ATCC 29141) GN=Cyan7425_0748 PE=4 SV=1: Response_reg [Tuwongella immobilis]